MIVDFFNPVMKKLKTFIPPKPGRALSPEISDREYYDISGGLTPEKLNAIMNSANSGDTRQLYQIATEIDEKNWAVKHALATRIAAVLKTPWHIEPASNDPVDEKIADDLSRDLRNCGGGSLDTFSNLLSDMAASILPGIAVSEIVWKPGGKLEGFARVPNKCLVFTDEYLFPRISVNTSAQNLSLPPAKFITHIQRSLSGDPIRGGLIRTVAWLHCFMSVNLKDMLRFIERYGMPFLVARVDEQTWQTERNVIKSLIRNFGPDGGGLFTRGTELELLQAASCGGDVYFKLLEYCEQAITKVVLGQTATSSSGGGFSKDNAQAAVREDLLESDCISIADTVNEQLIQPWTFFNYGNVKTPKIKFLIEPPEDLDKFARLIDTLQNAGLEADPEEMSQRFKLKLSRRLVTDESSKLALSAEKKEPSEENNTELQTLADNAEAEFLENGAEEWGGKLLEKLDAVLSDSSDPESQISNLNSLGQAADLALFDTGSLAEIIENTVYAAAADGAASKADTLSKTKGGK